MASSSARHLFLAAFVAVLAVADAWGGGRFFFSKTARAETAVEPGKQAAAAADTNTAQASTGRGYGLYGRPEENYPSDYFRRGVHRNAQKLTTTGTAPDVPAATTDAERVRAFPEDGSGRGRPPTDVPAATTGAGEEAVPAAGVDGAQPYPENGSGRGRPAWYYTGFRRGRQQGQEQEQEQEQRDFGMSDTRLYQNGRYYYDVDAGRYGYGRASNPMRARPDEAEEEYGRPAGDWRRGYGNAAGYQQEYGNGNSNSNGAMDENTNGFQEEGQNGQYIP